MFLIVELQTHQDGSLLHIEQIADDINTAYSKYYGILQYAAVSNLPCHSVCILSHRGEQIALQYFEHGEPTLAR